MKKCRFPKAAQPELPMGDSFFSKDKEFYRSFFQMMLVITLQNIVTYSINVADNIMLGAYDQTVLAGAAAVNQVQYILQQFTLAGLGEGFIIIAGQYRGRGDMRTVQQLVGAALCCGGLAALLLTGVAFASPLSLISIFTDNAAVQQQGLAYLSIIRFTYLPFVITNLLLVALRGVQVVKIAFRVSCMALVLNAGINYVLIFGRFGAPELGAQGAAIGTLVAQLAELLVVLCYCRSGKLPIQFQLKALFSFRFHLLKDYLKVSLPCAASALLFSCAVAIQTMIFGHLSVDAMAAASASGTLFQYVKMIPISAASAASVWISGLVGSGDRERLRPCVHSLQVIYACIGICTFTLLMLIREPILGMYAITPQAREYAMVMVMIQAVTSIGTAYQMPCQLGIIRAGGDTRYSMVSDLLYSWVLIVPLGLLAAFVWHWPVAVVTFCLNCDQLLKCITVSYKTNRYTWIKKLVRQA
ncbi:MAG: MATE family efflux transporter [Eubacteriales bacterium]|nr:MATE family efflux transporter [Eubacteriales bacterium]